MKKTFITAAIASTVAFAAPAAAATIDVLSIADGQTSCESGASKFFDAALLASCDVSTTNDLGNEVTDSNVNFLGYGVLTGYVADASGDTNGNFSDSALVNLAFGGLVTFTLVNPDSTFDATLTFGDVIGVFDDDNLSVSFEVAAGDYAFSVDTLAPFDNTVRDDSNWTLEVAELAAVPLPAGMVLLLTGLGGLAMARRKTAA